MKPVIRVELRGGLGNQLFQAAAGYAVARRIDGELQFELFNYRTNTGREFELGSFQLSCAVIRTPRYLSHRLLRKAEKSLRKIGWSYAPSWNGPIFQEQSYAYDARIQDISRSCYLRGYFQSWRYFDSCSAEVKTVFNPQKIASEAAQAFAHTMSPDGLIIHVRAGDYLENPKINAIHGVLGANYYHQAIQEMRHLGRAQKIYCFSDNFGVARQLLNGILGVQYVEGFNAADDMFLMSKGRSHIIANSTFSYWSAWLSDSDDPCVIAPRAWFSEEELKRTDTQDLYPPDWMIL